MTPISRVNIGLLVWASLLMISACTDGQQAPVTIPTIAQTVEVVDLPTLEAQTRVPAEPTATPPAPPALEPTPPPDGQPPQATATPLPALDGSVTTEPISYTITIISPVAGETIPVASDYVFRGTIQPIPAEPIEIFLAAAEDEMGSLLTFIEANPDSGIWETSAAIHPRRTGPAVFRVRAADSIATTPVKLAYPENQEGVYVTVNYPKLGGVAVAGRALLIEGESRNPIDGKIQAAVYGCPIQEKTKILAQLEIQVGNGPWHAFVILPEFTGSSCQEARLVVTSGGLATPGEQVDWSADILLTLVQPDHERARMMRIGDPFQIHFQAGQSTGVFGTAFTAADEEVTLRLVREPAGQPPEILMELNVPVDRFGYWEADLSLPAEVETGDAILIAAVPSAEGEISSRLATTIQP